jgi:hypothetical protein
MHHSTCQLWQSRSLIYCLHRQVIFAWFTLLIINS